MAKRFCEYIEVAVAIEVSHAAFVHALPQAHDLFRELAPAIPEENQNTCRGIVHPLRPVAHLAHEDIEITVSVDVGQLQIVSVDNVIDEGVRDPLSARPFVPVQRTVEITRHEHEFGAAAFHELASTRSCVSHLGIDHVGGEFAVASTMKPEAAADDVFRAVTIDVRFGQTFLTHLVRTFVDRLDWPEGIVAWLGGNLQTQQRLRALIPRDQLDFPVAVKITEDLIVVLHVAIALEHASLPAASLGMRIFPPPDLAASEIATEHNVRIAVAIDVVGGTAGFDADILRLDHLHRPATRVETAERECGPAVASTDDQIGVAIAVHVERQRRRGLDLTHRRRQHALRRAVDSAPGHGPVRGRNGKYNRGKKRGKGETGIHGAVRAIQRKPLRDTNPEGPWEVF